MTLRLSSTISITAARSRLRWVSSELCEAVVTVTVGELGRAASTALR
ncbi:hypothetical protein [Kutzneria sp. 744]